jgi:hexosaminidase
MPIIPLPAQIEKSDGAFRLTVATQIEADEANRWNAQFLQDLLRPPTGYPLPISSDLPAQTNAIRLRLAPDLAHPGEEGYRLSVTPAEVVIEAPETTGVFYGIQSLRQLLPPALEERQLVEGIEWTIPAQVITDQPRFAWRGFMLDEGRHFQGKETVLQILDIMALLKMNVFHWHLTEDQGWRIEIKKYPRLTEVGSHRPGTSKTIFGKTHDGIPHSGFYTQDEIRQIVAYAAERHITVVPEIEIPGHCTAALAAYPELSCTGGPFEVATHFGIFSDIYCAGKEAVFTFLQDVLDEIMDLFPSPYIHIGGDEAPKVRWKTCPDCQRRLKAEGLKDEHALQGYFTNRILTYIQSKGRQGIGWNEILQPGLVDGAAAQFWIRGRTALLEAIRGGKHPVIMTTYLDTYLDHSYSLMPLSRAYRYEPIPKELKESEAGSILGLEFPLWTEWVPNRARLEYQAWPRLTAAAETGWTPPERKDLADFHRRLEVFLPRLDRLGVRYAPPQAWEPSWWKQKLGVFTIAQPQTKTA